MATYDEFKEKSASEKNGLVRLEASKRLLGWSVHSGSVYSIDFTESAVITDITDSGVSLAEVGSIGAVVADTFFFDRAANTIYLQTLDSSDPNTKFLACFFRLFFAEAPTIAPHDLSTGFDVEWLPYLRELSEFGVRLNNADQLGEALEGSGSINFVNNLDYWRPLYDKVFFENKRVEVYSWSHGLPITEAKIIFRGRIQSKSYTQNRVSLRVKDIINELRTEPILGNIEDVSGVRVPDALLKAKQRRIYGDVQGFRPTNIDQVLDGYPLTGTLSLTLNSPTVTGSGTTFLNDLSPDDQIVVDGVEDRLTVETIASDTSLTLSQDFELASTSGVSFSVLPDRSKPYTNRTHFVSGDALAESSTTVTVALNALIFDVADSSGIRAGDTVIVNGEERTVLRVSGDTVRVTVAFTTAPSVSDTVTRPSFSNVRINNQLLVRTRDFTVPASNDRIVLDTEAEFNTTKITTLSPGTITFNATRTVTGTGTAFTNLRPGDWIRPRGVDSDFFEILQIASDTSLTLRTTPATSGTAAADLKQPNYYTENEDFLTCTVIGKTDDGTKTGTHLSNGPEIVRDIIRSVNIDDSLVDETSFTLASQLNDARIGLVIPENFDDTTVRKSRDIINDVNKSIIGALVQDENLDLGYRVLAPGRVIEDFSMDETDTLSFSITSKSDRIVKDTNVEYNRKEYDPEAGVESVQIVTFSSQTAEYLAETFRQRTVESVLVDETDAELIAQRLAFLREVSSNIIRIQTKLRPARLQVTDIINFSHPKLFERFGSDDNRRVAAVQSISKSSTGVTIELDDLGGTFPRVPTITQNTANNFAASSDLEKAIGGYITDNNGMISNDSSTAGLNLIY